MRLAMIRSLVKLCALAAVLAPAGTLDAAQLEETLGQHLPEGWRADIGIPVQLSDGHLLLYGDTWYAEGGASRNTVVLDDGAVISPAIRNGVDRWWWPSDAVQLADGSLFVLAGEVIDDGSDLGFDVIDTDAFVVSDPRNPMAWRWADKIEDGPWESLQVQFLDQAPFLVGRELRRFETAMWQYDPADPTAPWVSVGDDFPQSHGVFAPIQTATGWFGMSWEMWNTATLWRSDRAVGPWEVVDRFETETMTYDHGLNVVNGQVVYRWSNGEAGQRPEYVRIEL